MAQIDMNKINTKIGDSAEIKKSDNTEQAETSIETVESFDNATETTEDNSETTPKESEEATKTESNGKVVVTYVGNSIWKDANGELWASNKKSDNILSDRQYTIDEYEKREDIKFMVGYGAMKATHVK
jgi:hypothetical protein